MWLAFLVSLFGGCAQTVEPKAMDLNLQRVALNDGHFILVLGFGTYAPAEVSWVALWLRGQRKIDLGRVGNPRCEVTQSMWLQISLDFPFHKAGTNLFTICSAWHILWSPADELILLLDRSISHFKKEKKKSMLNKVACQFARRVFVCSWSGFSAFLYNSRNVSSFQYAMIQRLFVVVVTREQMYRTWRESSAVPWLVNFEYHAIITGYSQSRFSHVLLSLLGNFHEGAYFHEGVPC